MSCGEPPVPWGRGVTDERIDFEKTGINSKACRRDVLVPIAAFGVGSRVRCHPFPGNEGREQVIAENLDPISRIVVRDRLRRGDGFLRSRQFLIQELYDENPIATEGSEVAFCE